MAENMEHILWSEIESKLQGKKGLRLGDDKFNRREKELYDSILAEKGAVIAATKEDIGNSFRNLLDDVADISESNQFYLREVAKKLGEPLKVKKGALQMNYPLFQKILQFQSANHLPLTGIADKKLYQQLLAAPNKTATPPTKEAATQPARTQKTAPTPKTAPAPHLEPTPQTAPAPKTTSDQPKPTPKAVPVAPAAAQEAPVPPKQTPPAAPVRPDPAPKSAPIPKTTPPESNERDADALTRIETLPSGLKIAKGPGNTVHPLISQGKMTDMIITYEWPGGSRQPDTGGTFDIGGWINTSGPELERKYALGDRYTEWTRGYIPTTEVRNAVEKTLEARIARTYESCRKRGIDFDALPLFAQKVLVDLHYNMNSIQGDFPKFWNAIKAKDWKEAGKQLMDSGKGYPNTYLTDVYTRSYANAMMLAKEDPDGASKYKDEAVSILKGSRNEYLLYNAFFEKVGRYGDHVGFLEKWKITKETQDPLSLVDLILSDDVLKADKKSTATIQSLLAKHLKENPLNRETIISELRTRFGGFSGLLDTGKKIGAYQAYVALMEPERFKKDIEFIDGEYGPRTRKNYLDDAFIVWEWTDKMEGSEGLLKKNPPEIQAFIGKLSVFEKTLLQHHYERYLNISQDAPEDDIKKAQLVLNLIGKVVAIDGKWTNALGELLWYSEKAKRLSQFVQNNYRRFNSGRNSCGASVGNMLAGFGMRWLPSSGRNGENWNEYLDAMTPERFIKVPIANPSQARPGGILCYEDGGVWGAAVIWGHVEVKWQDGAYYHYLRSEKWGGSRWQDVKNSHFIGYVYYPRDVD